MNTVTIGVPWQQGTPRRKCATISANKINSARGGNYGFTWPRQKWFVTIERNYL